MLQGTRPVTEKEQLESLSKRYNTTAFMYTEYPHKNFWLKEFGEEEYKKALLELFSQDKKVPLMLYVHIPFCEQLCWFCTCHMSITKEYDKISRYLGYLFKEIDLLREFFEKNSVKPNFVEIHLGGGSPTYVRQEDFERLIEKLGSLTDLHRLDEFALEIDPRQVDRQRVKYYASKGITRISFGVQDFDIEVQKAVNRLQPAELIANLLTPDVRKLFKNGVNFDLICGLPHQTPETIRKTCEKVMEFSPDRICLNYLHYAPTFAPHQKIMMDGRNGRPGHLPDFYERKTIFIEALNTLTEGGYVRTGYDHFAKPTDAVAQAMKKGKMHWNALGVTPGRCVDVIGVGVFSLTTLGEYYFQNLYETPDYEAAVSGGKFPIYRGYKLNQDDLIRRDVIQTLRSFFFLDFSRIEKDYGIRFKDYFKKELVTLRDFVKDGIVEISDTSITITEVGHQFANLVCRDFDRFYGGNIKAADVGALYDDR